MCAFDALPGPLRRWLAQASLPWSPSSCRRIWQSARSRGESAEAVLARLDRAEARPLARNGWTDAAGTTACRIGIAGGRMNTFK